MSFDPSQPFQVVDAPQKASFDPTKPFQVIVGQGAMPVLNRFQSGQAAPLPTPGLLGQIGQGLSMTGQQLSSPIPQVDAMHPTTMVGGAVKELLGQANPANVAALYGGGKLFQGLGDVIKAGGQAGKGAEVLRAGATAPFVAQGIQGVAAGIKDLYDNWDKLSPPERGQRMAAMGINGAMTSPLLFLEKSALNEFAKSKGIPVTPEQQRANVNFAGAEAFKNRPKDTTTPPQPSSAPQNPFNPFRSSSPTQKATPTVASLPDISSAASKQPRTTEPINVSASKETTPVTRSQPTLPGVSLPNAGAQADLPTDLAAKSKKASEDMAAMFAKQLGLPTKKPTAPLTFQPVTMVNGKPFDLGQEHSGTESQIEFNRIKQATGQYPTIQRGFMGSDGKFYKTALEAARAKMGTTPTGEQNETGSRQQNENASGQEAQEKGSKGQGQGEDVGRGIPQSGVVKEVKGEIPGAVKQSKPAGSGVDVKSQVLTKEEQEIEQRRLQEGGFVIAPKEIWDKVWSNKGVKIDPQQMFNRLKNVMGEGSGVFKALQSAGLAQFLTQPRSTDEVEKWAEGAVEKPEVVTYGMEGKVSEAKKEYDRMTHEWYDTLKPTERHTLNDVMDGGRTLETWLTQNGYKTGESKYANQMVDNAAKYMELHNQVKQETRNPSPRATSAYSHVSAFDTTQPMPEWTTSKSGKNVQRVDVVVPQKELSTAEGQTREDNLNYDLERHTDLDNGGKVTYKEKPKWQPDNLHENLPNTLGWAMIQYKTGPKGEKIAVINEAQSRWGQQMREARQRSEKMKNSNNAAGMQRNEMELAQDHPLLRDYNRLILKAAIEQARKEGATHIMVSDAETAMMTEGHDRTAVRHRQDETYSRPEAASENLEDYIDQAKGMRLHYDTILPKIAEELTGGKGEKVSLGEHKNAMELNPDRQMIPDDEGRATGTMQPRSNLIFRNPDGTPKTSVTGRLFPIKDTAKPIPKEFSLYGKSGAIFPTPPKGTGTKTLAQIRQQKAPLESLRDKFIASIKTSAPKDVIIRAKDAADNQARIYANQVKNGLEAHAKQIFGSQSELALRGTTAAIEANGDVKKLDNFIAVAKAKRDAEGLAAANFAKNNWTKLQPLVKEVNDVHSKELAEERFAGLDTTEREAYIKHAYDVTKIPDSLADTFFGSKGGSGDRGFLKSRVFDTLYDAIEQGYGKAIKSWNAANLVESRLTSGQQMVNDVKWLEGLKEIKDPTTKMPIVTDLIARKNLETGKLDMVPPRGYETWGVAGRGFAVHRGYKNLFNSITALSDIRQFEVKGLPVGEAALKTVGGLKHSMLVFDSYHAMRMFVKGLSLGVRGYGKGLSLLEYQDKDLDVALKNGDITKEAYDYAKDNRAVAERLIKGGLNVGRIQEGLDSEVITHLAPTIGKYLAGDLGEKVAGIPATANRWIFEKLTRGIMMDAGVREYTRLRKEGLKDAEAIPQVVKDINTNFGNLGRQGFFRSKTAQDLSKMIFLAPQWVESMMKTELKSAGQSVKYLGQAVQGRKPVAGTLLRGTSNLLFWTFVGTQVANLATTGHPTWDNEEGHKLDAWIPGGANGFWVSPLSLPMELTLDVIRYTAKGDTPLQTASQIFSNKESPLFRAAETIKEQRDYVGRPLSTGETLKSAGEGLIPLPLPLQPIVKGGYPGQTERQLLASAGIKAEPAQGARAIVGNLRRQFLYKMGRAKQPDFEVGEHQPLIDALAKGDVTTAKEAYQQVLMYGEKLHQYDPDPQHEAMMDMQKFFKTYAENRGQMDKATDAAFVKTLTYHQKELYDQVMKQQQDVAAKFFKEIQPPIDNRPRGFKPPSLRMSRGFSSKF